jgi:CHAD domain-containing protein
MRYLTEFVVSRHADSDVAPWLKWLKQAQEVLGARNDRSTAEIRINQLCSTLPPHHGKVRKTLREALKAQPLPELDVSKPPVAYWG